MTQPDDRGETRKRKQLARQADEARERNLRTLIDGTIQPRDDDLRTKLVKELARIDQDHISRGIYNSTVRLADRLEARALSLRAAFKLRVRSTFKAYEAAGVVLGNDAAQGWLAVIHRFGDEERSEMLQEARMEARKSQLAPFLIEQLENAVHRECGKELHRATRLFETEWARHKLQDQVSRPVVGAGGAKPTIRVAEPQDLSGDKSVKLLAGSIAKPSAVPVRKRPASKPEPVAPQLSLRARRTVILLQERTASQPITGPNLVKELGKRWASERNLSSETLRSSVIPAIRRHGPVPNEQGVGYWLAKDSVVRRWVVSGDA